MIKQIRTYAYHQLTGEDILFKNSNISVPIGPAVFMKEANSVAKFVDDISHLTPQGWAAYRQFLLFISPATNTRGTAEKKKTRRENLNFIKPYTLSLSYFIRAFRWNDLHVLGSNYEKSKSLQMSLQRHHFLLRYSLKDPECWFGRVWPPAAERHSANCYELTSRRKSEEDFFYSHSLLGLWNGNQQRWQQL